MIEKSESIKEITKALVQFNSEVSKIKKDSINPFFKSKYADLSSILDGICEPLQKNGLAVIQMPSGENYLTTLLTHTSGEYLQSTYYMKPQKNDPQGFGSCITYQRRYALGGILNLNIDEDDDGNGASNQKPIQSASQTIHWLSQENFQSAMSCGNASKIQATIKAYSTQEKKMRKEYKQALENQIKVLGN
jgi:hypothetical protein